MNQYFIMHEVLASIPSSEEGTGICANFSQVNTHTHAHYCTVHREKLAVVLICDLEC